MAPPLYPAQFHAVQLNAPGAIDPRDRRHAEVAVAIVSEDEGLVAAALRWPSWRSWRVHGFPIPKEEAGYERMDLSVRLPMLASRTADSRFRAIRRLVTDRLDRAGVRYAIIQVEIEGLVYLPKDSSSDHR